MNKRLTLILLFLLHLASIFAIVPERMISATDKGHWMAIAALFLIELPILWLYLKALALFPEKTAADICMDALGKWGARLIVLPLLIFLFLLIFTQMYYQTVEIKAVLLQQTPFAATSVLYVFLIFYGAWKGLSVIIRSSMLWFFLYMPFVLFSMLISIKNLRFSYIFPVWDGSFSFLFHPDFYVGMVIYAGFLFLGMTSSKKPIGFGKAAAVVGIVFVFAMGSVYIPLLVFGQETAVHMKYPLLMASDTIDMEWVVFDWLPSFYVVSSNALGVLKASVLIWMFVSLLHLLFIPKANSKWILSIASIILYVSVQLIPNENTLNNYLYLNSYFCLYSTIGFPIIVFLVAQWRRRKVNA
ncbi:GerAB/ArcD/ProY family transporter [Gorillibacterium massiliense]|uniref:GerAB/ArcD/ProY family transporter n=1 Tax=Gorillibacterium massiliense TaxID=1280390 RepID=UPI0004B58CCC|nr:GerAB/ArcD/ProY family transporter [Gorillibacterium massiliense]